jgi:hypothetical protein
MVVHGKLPGLDSSTVISEVRVPNIAILEAAIYHSGDLIRSWGHPRTGAGCKQPHWAAERETYEKAQQRRHPLRFEIFMVGSLFSESLRLARHK